MSVAQEPDWNQVVNDILDEGDPDIDGAPTGIDERYFTGHTKDIAIIEGFDYSIKWIESKPVLHEFLKEVFTDWWEDLGVDDSDFFEAWFNGGRFRYDCDAYLDDLVLKLVNLYRERIVETHKCSVCGKEISEKHPYKHPDSVVRVGHAVDYPDGVPMDTPTDEIEWKNNLYCYPCWEERVIKKGPRIQQRFI